MLQSTDIHEIWLALQSEWLSHIPDLANQIQIVLEQETCKQSIGEIIACIKKSHEIANNLGFSTDK